MQSILKKILKKFHLTDNETTLRETIEELIEESDEDSPSIESDERQLIGNVLDLRDLTAQDVMTPRADIIAVPLDSTPESLMAEFVRTGISRLPVYKDTLDNIVGMVGVKEMLAWHVGEKPFKIKSVMRDVLYISPAMRTLDLLLQMRESGRKLAVVVDEYGGVDGIVSFSSLIEEIIGDIQDAQASSPKSQISVNADGSIWADARTTLEELEEELGQEMNLNPNGEDIDTLGGLVVYLAGRVPVRGELISHPNGIDLEVLDADPRRVKRLSLRNFRAEAATTES
jgi:magnesium and cobalt transporter